MGSNDTVPFPCIDSAAFKVTVSVALVILILVTVVGNVVVCLAVGLNRQLRSLTNCFIVSLAITDLLLGLLVLPFSAIYQLSCSWNLGQAFCKIYTSLDVMLCTASILNLFMISLDRYYAVTDPLRYPVLVTPARVGISLVFIWAVSITLSFLPIHLGWNSRNETSGLNHNFTSCKVQVNLVYGLVDGLVTFYVPLVVMCATYYRIFRIARDQAKRIQQISSWKAASIREHKATVTLAAVMGAFIVCWFPYFTVFVYRGLRGDDAINKVFEAVVLWLGYANSALNPILYAALNRDFRTAYQQLLHCRSASRHTHDAARRSESSWLSRTRTQEPRQQEEKPLKLRVWSERAPQGTADRTPRLSCAVCSSNLLSCCKSLWGRGFLQTREGPAGQQPLRTLSSHSVYTRPQDTEDAAPSHQAVTPGATKGLAAPEATKDVPQPESGVEQRGCSAFPERCSGLLGPHTHTGAGPSLGQRWGTFGIRAHVFREAHTPSEHSRWCCHEA